MQRWLVGMALMALSGCSSPSSPDVADTGSADAGDGLSSTDATDVGTSVDTPGDVPMGVRVPTDRGFATLQEYGLFVGNGATQQPVPGVIPYDVNAPLYADYMYKNRFLYVPPGSRIVFRDNDRWEFPVGSMLVKTFYYPADEREPTRNLRLLETRLLIRGPTTWFAEDYRWNDAQTEATRFVAGGEVPVSWIDRDGMPRTTNYVIPNRVECGRCHGDPDPMRPTPMNVLGPRTGQMNRLNRHDGVMENQIAYLARLGLFDRMPPTPGTLESFPDPFGTAPIEQRARAYLHSNCAHCHNPTSPSGFSGLRLNVEITDPLMLGICKIPSSAGDTGGRRYDIVPGDPSMSVLPYRMQLERSEAMMPPLGRTLHDRDGVQLINDWIAAMPAMTCR